MSSAVEKYGMTKGSTGLFYFFTHWLQFRLNSFSLPNLCVRSLKTVPLSPTERHSLSFSGACQCSTTHLIPFLPQTRAFWRTLLRGITSSPSHSSQPWQALSSSAGKKLYSNRPHPHPFRISSPKPPISFSTEILSSFVQTNTPQQDQSSRIRLKTQLYQDRHLVPKFKPPHP